MEFDSFISNIREALNGDADYLNLKNGLWQTPDQIQLWKLIGSRIFDSHLDIFSECAVQVLGEKDPKFELPVTEHYATHIHGKALRYSAGLRKGLAGTLALINNYSEELVNCSNGKAKYTSVVTLRQLLENADWQVWASLNNLLPILSESAPDEFFNIIDGTLKSDPCPYDMIFFQEGDGITGGNYMTGLLWALEGLAWHEDYLTRSAITLAELATHDPGGTWANRPINSLKTILIPWFPQTLAPIEKRFSAIKAIILDFPDVAWEVLMSLLPNQHQTSSGTHKPQFVCDVPEDWKPEVSGKDYRQQIIEYAELAVSMAENDLGKLSELSGNLDNLPKSSFDALLKHLSSENITSLSEKDRLPIWLSLTSFITKHRRFSDAKWALAETTIASIENVAKVLIPSSPESLNGRLFGSRDYDLFEDDSDWQEQEKKLKEMRKNALQEILSLRDLDGVLAFTTLVENPRQVGISLAEIAKEDIDLKLLPQYISTDSSELRQFISGYIWNSYWVKKWDWVDSLDRSKWTDLEVKHFLLNLPFSIETWVRVNTWLGDAENDYWKETGVNPYESDESTETAIEKLIEVKRPLAALACLGFRLRKKLPLQKDQVVTALIDAVNTEESSKHIDSYYMIELIKYLQNHPDATEDDLFKVEWAYLPILERDDNAEALYLESRLASDPDFFCEVIRLIYRSNKEDKPVNEVDDSTKSIATNAWRLLHDWQNPPGLKNDVFSPEKLNKWLEHVKNSCSESGHLEVAMIKVGEVLFYSPEDSEGLWIDKIVANILNAPDGDELRSGFRTEVFNSRGAHWVDPTGNPERELAANWRSKAEEVEKHGFARFATTLRSIAESYDRDAVRMVEDKSNSTE